MLQSVEAHRAGHNLATEQEQQSYLMLLSSVSVLDFFIETKQMGGVCVCMYVCMYVCVCVCIICHTEFAYACREVGKPQDF